MLPYFGVATGAGPAGVAGGDGAAGVVTGVTVTQGEPHGAPCSGRRVLWFASLLKRQSGAASRFAVLDPKIVRGVFSFPHGERATEAR